MRFTSSTKISCHVMFMWCAFYQVVEFCYHNKYMIVHLKWQLHVHCKCIACFLANLYHKKIIKLISIITYNNVHVHVGHYNYLCMWHKQSCDCHEHTLYSSGNRKLKSNYPFVVNFPSLALYNKCVYIILHIYHKVNLFTFIMTLYTCIIQCIV